VGLLLEADPTLHWVFDDPAVVPDEHVPPVPMEPAIEQELPPLVPFWAVQ
jgi:hypothetical protein